MSSTLIRPAIVHNFDPSKLTKKYVEGVTP